MSFSTGAGVSASEPSSDPPVKISIISSRKKQPRIARTMMTKIPTAMTTIQKKDKPKIIPSSDKGLSVEVEVPVGLVCPGIEDIFPEILVSSIMECMKKKKPAVVVITLDIAGVASVVVVVVVVVLDSSRLHFTTLRA